MKHTATELAKFKKLKRRLGLPKYAVIGLLEALWHATQRNSPRGDIGAKLDNEDIAIELDWEGDADDLIQALIDTKWLDVSDEYRLIVHDWHDHAPSYIHGVLARHKQEFVSVSNLLKEPTIVTSYSNLPTPPLVDSYSNPVPNLTKPNLTKEDSSEPDKPTHEPEPAVLEFSTVGKPATWPLTQKQLDEWATLYPNTDVLGEARKALAWLNANPTRRKTAKGMPKFFVNWLNTANDRVRSPPHGNLFQQAKPQHRQDGEFL